MAEKEVSILEKLGVDIGFRSLTRKPLLRRILFFLPEFPEISILFIHVKSMPKRLCSRVGLLMG